MAGRRQSLSRGLSRPVRRAVGHETVLGRETATEVGSRTAEEQLPDVRCHLVPRSPAPAAECARAEWERKEGQGPVTNVSTVVASPNVDEQQRDAQAAQASAARQHLADRGVVGVAATWVDNSGVTRVKAVPLAKLESAARWGIGASPVFDAFLPDDVIVAGRVAGGPVGDLRLHPDLDRLVVLQAQPGWAWAPAVRYRQDGEVHPQDQRSKAIQAVAALAEAGYTAKMAFELEWALSTTAPEFTPAATRSGVRLHPADRALGLPARPARRARRAGRRRRPDPSRVRRRAVRGVGRRGRARRGGGHHGVGARDDPRAERHARVARLLLAEGARRGCRQRWSRAPVAVARRAEHLHRR